MALSRRTWIATVAFVTLIEPTRAGDDLVAECMKLWRSCRVAIETVQPLDTTGLSRIELLPEEQANYDKRSSRWAAWSSAGRRFAVIEREQKAQPGAVTRSCDVRTAPGAAALSVEEQATVIRAFLIERGKLISEGTHTIRDPSPVYPLIPVGVGPVTANPNGCAVISYIFFEATLDLFWGGTGEQVTTRCGGPSLMGFGNPNIDPKPIKLNR